MSKTKNIHACKDKKKCLEDGVSLLEGAYCNSNDDAHLPGWLYALPWMPLALSHDHVLVMLQESFVFLKTYSN